MLTVALNDPVIALWAGPRRREPDLLVRRLLVDHVGAVGPEADREDASLRSERRLEFS